jgi:hypothetical protein
LPHPQINFSEIVSRVEAGIFGSRGIVENPDLLQGEVVKNLLDFTPYSSNSKTRETQIQKNLTKDPDIIVYSNNRNCISKIFSFTKTRENKLRQNVGYLYVI